MRILWVKLGGLWPLNTGGRQRSFHIVSHLANKHRVTVLTTHGPGDKAEELAAQLPQCQQVISIPYFIPKRDSVGFAIALLRSWFSRLPVDLWRWHVPAIRNAVLQQIKADKLDLCVADFLTAIANVPLDASVPVVLFAHNVEHMIWNRLARIETRPWRRAALELEWRKMRRCELLACTRATLTLAVSEVDREILAACGPPARVDAIPTGVDTSYFKPNGTPELPARLVFTGSMDWYPNEDAILHFIDSVLPRIRHDVPDVSVTVAGRNPTRRLIAAAGRTGVRVTGTIDDVRPHVQEAAVYVVPLRIGGGTRLKIFEALAMAKAVVSTRVGAEGLPLVRGDHFLQADNPADFARAVVSLIRDPERRRALGAAGRKLVEEQFSWSRVAHEFESRCKEVVGHAY